MRNLATVLPFKSKLSVTIQRFNGSKWKYRNAEKKVEFPKILFKIKNCKTFYETQAAIGLKRK